MLGITIPDAIAIGTLIIAVLAAWRGSGAGNAAKKLGPPPDSGIAMIGAAIVDRDTLAQLTTAVTRLVDAIERAIDDRERGMQDKIDELIRRLDNAEVRHPRR